jgi:YHS domain-containing protein
MTKSIRYALLAVGTAGVLALTNHLAAADTAMPGCCSMGLSTLAADATTNAVPDLLATCPVSGDKLGEMGKPFTFTYQGQEVKLCCGGCKKDFDKDPAKYVAKIRAADKK